MTPRLPVAPFAATLVRTSDLRLMVVPDGCTLPAGRVLRAATAAEIDRALGPFIDEAAP